MVNIIKPTIETITIFFIIILCFIIITFFLSNVQKHEIAKKQRVNESITSLKNYEETSFKNVLLFALLPLWLFLLYLLKEW